MASDYKTQLKDSTKSQLHKSNLLIRDKLQDKFQEKPQEKLQKSEKARKPKARVIDDL